MPLASPKLIFAAISAAASVAGAVMKIRAAKEQAALQKGVIELQMEQARTQAGYETAARFDRHRRIVASQINYGGASGSQFGSRKAGLRAAANLYERDRQIIQTNYAFRSTQLSYQRLGVNLMKKNTIRSATIEGISSVASLGHTAYTGGYGLDTTQPTSTSKGASGAGPGYNISQGY